MRRVLLTVLLAVLPCAVGQYTEPPPLNPDPINRPAVERTAVEQVPSAAAADDPQAPVPREQTRVAVLGYHNFSETKPVTEMLMRTSEFRRQMEYLKREGLRVISMKEFLDWRLGNLHLPARCVLITLDDGWRSVYTDAYPILKEYGYPFTVFLYTKYLSGRGDSMTPAMVREMKEHGATIGSHSTSHLYPKQWKAVEAKGEEAYNELMDKELGSSHKRLSELFGPISTYCYPGGYISPPMLERLPGYGYVAAFGIIPGKVSSTEDVWQIHRYMIFGTDGSVFEDAVDFDGRLKESRKAKRNLQRLRNSPVPPFPVTPAPDSIAKPELPVISAQLGGITGADLNSVRMTVSGFGRVPARVDAATATVQWVPPYRLYLPTLTVKLTWKNYDGSQHSAQWFFYIDDTINPEN